MLASSSRPVAGEKSGYLEKGLEHELYCEYQRKRKEGLVDGLTFAVVEIHTHSCSTGESIAAGTTVGGKRQGNDTGFL